jgi:hypothetical protein
MAASSTPHRFPHATAGGSARLQRDVAQSGGYVRYLKRNGVLFRPVFWSRLLKHCARQALTIALSVAALREPGLLRLVARAAVHRALLDVAPKAEAPQ